MESNIKISLSIELQGSTLIRKSEPEIILIKQSLKDLNPNRKFKSNEEANKIIKSYKTKHYGYYTPSARKVINMTKDAYEYFLSHTPSSYKEKKRWKNVPTKEKINLHMKEYCEAFNGLSYEFKIFED